MAAFKRLLAKSDKLKRVNQWEEVVAEIMKNDALRNYQQEMIDRLEEAWSQYRSVMVQMPTGTGKTVLMAEVIRQRISRITRKGKDGILIVAHRRELLDQIRGTVGYFGIDMKKNHIMVESIQKLSRELGHTDSTENTESFSDTNYTNFEPSLVIIDEAHHGLARAVLILCVYIYPPKAYV